MDNRKLFRTIAKKYITRDGIDELLDSLDSTPFYTDPSSARYHDAHEGGGVEHLLRVFKILFVRLNARSISQESIAITALFHDLCKTGTYKVSSRNVKEGNKWIQVPYYEKNDTIPLGHGDKSIIMILDKMKLTYDEMLAIRWHMGLSVPKEEYSMMSEAFNQSELALWLHFADMESLYGKDLDLLDISEESFIKYFIL